MSLFGGGKKPKQTPRMRLVPRPPGDSTPLDPVIAEAVRRAGLDPTKFTAAPLEEGETDAAVGAFGSPGTHLEHTFLFPSLSGAFDAMEKLLAGDVGARIRKEADGWLVSFDAPANEGTSDGAAHQRFADVASSLGAQDRGFTRMTVAVNTRVVSRKAPG